MRVMDCRVGIGCSEGWVRSSGRGGRKRSKCRCGKKTALLSKVPSYTTNLAMPEVVTKSSHGSGARCCRDNRGGAGHYCPSRRMAGRVPNYGDRLWFRPPWLFGQRCDEGLIKVTKAEVGVKTGGAVRNEPKSSFRPRN